VAGKLANKSFSMTPDCQPSPRKVDIRLPGKGNSNSHGARPDHQIISMIKWIRTSVLSIKNALPRRQAGNEVVQYDAGRAAQPVLDQYGLVSQYAH